MKKIMIMLTMVMIIIAANAQEKKNYVSGSLGYGYNIDTEAHSLTIAPEYGVYFTKNAAFGTELVYAYMGGAHVFSVAPYVRYDFAKCGNKVVFFADFGVSAGYATGHDAIWSIGVKPGVKVELTKSLAFIAKVGMLGYSDNLNGRKFGFDLSTNGLNLGLEYAF